MEINPINPNSPNQPKESSFGPLAGSIIIIVILIIGGIYVFKQNWSEPVDTTPPTTQELRTQSDSTSLADIKADVESTDIDNLDAELDQIEAELNI